MAWNVSLSVVNGFIKFPIIKLKSKTFYCNVDLNHIIILHEHGTHIHYITCVHLKCMLYSVVRIILKIEIYAELYTFVIVTSISQTFGYKLRCILFFLHQLVICYIDQNYTLWTHKFMTVTKSKPICSYIYQIYMFWCWTTCRLCVKGIL